MLYFFFHKKKKNFLYQFNQLTILFILIFLVLVMYIKVKLLNILYRVKTFLLDH